MSNQEILDKAIRQALNGGWKRPSYAPNISVENLVYDALDGIPYWQSILFNHDFAKALWGEEEIYETTSIGAWIPDGLDFDYEYGIKWKVKLCEMVIAPDPIKYLGDNL